MYMRQKSHVVYKVIFDTNILWTDNENKINGLNSNTKESVAFIKENNLQESIFLAVPDLLVRERTEQTLKQIEINLSKIEAGANALKDWGVKISENIYKKDFRKKVEQKILDTLKSLDVEIILTPKFDQDKLITRAIEKTLHLMVNRMKGLRMLLFG